MLLGKLPKDPVRHLLTTSLFQRCCTMNGTCHHLPHLQHFQDTTSAPVEATVSTTVHITNHNTFLSMQVSQALGPWVVDRVVDNSCVPPCYNTIYYALELK